MTRLVVLAVFLAGATVLAGCLGSEPPVDPAGSEAPANATHADLPTCKHPWPCADGSEWPEDLEASNVSLGRLEHIRVESHDGTRLEGWIFHPDLPEGVEAPVVLHATPYIGVCNPGFNSFVVSGYSCNELPDESWAEEGGLVETFLSRGYAVALFSTRGTGGSDGCFGQHSLEEQRDYAHLVNWLGERNWSNGRVGMYGLSYPGTTPFDAAIHQPEHLKTIVPGGIISDWYTFYTTPQGATRPFAGWREVKYDYTVSLSRPSQALLVHQDPAYAPVLTERACTEHVEHPSVQSSWLATDERPEAYFDERRLIDHFGNITASVFITQGLLDNSGHATQEDHVWGTLENAPKRMLLGQWGHTFPEDSELLEGSSVGNDWNHDVLIPWMDFWLKGVGDPAELRLGTVDYEDTAGGWHSTTAWPPSEAELRALYLAGGSLATEPGSDTASFRSVPTPPEHTRCQGEEPANVAAFFTEPVEEPATLAGNAFLHLLLEADQLGGAFDVALLDAGPGVDSCGDLFGDLAGTIMGGRPYADGVSVVTAGAADLRYHAGNFEGQDFPVGEPTPVRVDLWNQAWTLEPGHRLVVLVTGLSPRTWSSPPSEITIHPGSHLVVPTLEGSIGADLPDVDHPPRPFVPPGNETGVVS